MNDKDETVVLLVGTIVKYYNREIPYTEALQILQPLCKSLEFHDIKALSEYLAHWHSLSAQLAAELLLEAFQNVAKYDGIVLIQFFLGNIFYGRNKFKEATNFYNRALELLLDSSLGLQYKDYLTQITYAELGKAYIFLNEAKVALVCLNKSLEIAKLRKDKLSCAQYYQDMGVAYRKLQQLSKTLEFYLKALEEIKDK